MAITVKLFHEVYEPEKKHRYQCDSCGESVYAVVSIGKGTRVFRLCLCRECVEQLAEDTDYLIHNIDPEGKI